MIQPNPMNKHAGRIVLLQLLVLLALMVPLFASMSVGMASVIVSDYEASHALAVPSMILLLCWLCRADISIALAAQRGSYWGVAFILLGLLMYAMLSWPFAFGYPKRLSLIPLIAGVILAIGGWRLLRLSVVMLLLVAVAIPIGTRYYAFAVIKPETMTLAICARLLDVLPGVMVAGKGLDLTYVYQGAEGSIALGEPFRGASMLLAYLTLCIFVAGARIRPWWQLVVLAGIAIPVVLFCNLLRLFVFGLVTIYGATGSVSTTPRVAATIISLVFCYILFGLLTWSLGQVIVVDGQASFVEG